MTTGKVVTRVLAVAVPAALGVLAVLFSGSLRQLPAPNETTRQPTPVRVVTLAPMPLIPRVSGYGTVQPVREWRAVARIEGEVFEIAPGLAAGDLVPEGTVLFRLDDSDLRLDLAAIDAQLTASQLKDVTVQASLDLARSDLDLVQQDLARQEKLNQQGVVTQAALETTRRQELTARTKVTELGSQITLNAAEREVLSTQRAALLRAIGFAEIRAPYDLRVTDLSADLGQYLTRGQVMLTGEGVEAVDISAQFPIGRIGPLLRQAGEGATVLDLTAKVRLPAADHAVVWPAKVVRIGEAIDERTQSSAIVVRVEDPQGQSVAGQRPPLRRNMFVEVELSAPKQQALVVPAEAVRDGAALVVSAEGTLEKRKVETGFAAGEIAVLTKGVAPGEQLVVTDPTIAVPGMAVKPVEDEARLQEVAAAALGQAPGAQIPGSGAGGGQGKKKEAAQ